MRIKWDSGYQSGLWSIKYPADIKKEWMFACEEYIHAESIVEMQESQWASLHPSLSEVLLF